MDKKRPSVFRGSTASMVSSRTSVQNENTFVPSQTALSTPDFLSCSGLEGAARQSTILALCLHKHTAVRRKLKVNQVLYIDNITAVCTESGNGSEVILCNRDQGYCTKVRVAYQGWALEEFLQKSATSLLHEQTFQPAWTSSPASQKSPETRWDVQRLRHCSGRYKVPPSRAN